MLNSGNISHEIPATTDARPMREQVLSSRPACSSHYTATALCTLWLN